jgi:hypothetical protein
VVSVIAKCAIAYNLLNEAELACRPFSQGFISSHAACSSALAAKLWQSSPFSPVKLPNIALTFKAGSDQEHSNTEQMCSLNADEYDGWEIYPQNLRFIPLEVDAARSNWRISQLSKELFVANHESTFGYMDFSTPETGMRLQS